MTIWDYHINCNFFPLPSFSLFAGLQAEYDWRLEQYFQRLLLSTWATRDDLNFTRQWNRSLVQILEFDLFVILSFFLVELSSISSTWGEASFFSTAFISVSTLDLRGWFWTILISNLFKNHVFFINHNLIKI